MTTAPRRVVARKPHRCDVCATSGKIEPGHVYLRHVAFPGGDTHDGPAPWVLRECLDCAHTYGRSTECYPIPEGQPDRYWLGDVDPSALDDALGSDR